MTSFIIKGSESGPLISGINDFGICASSDSAYSADSGEPSQILKAAGYPDELAGSSLHLSPSERNDESDVGYILEKLP